MRILFYLALFILLVLLVWSLKKLFSDRQKVQQLLQLFHFLSRYISPYILIRLILKLLKK
ncbi:MAG TPA: hypothetical protein EYM80_05270 [Deltaproteobacteria bacterium]|nr:hypothetical protein [Deltaproteobacteria bacterium]HIN47618.1 hypothetical protein [Deltaproteobacteria bacterium]